MAIEIAEFTRKIAIFLMMEEHPNIKFSDEIAIFDNQPGAGTELEY